MKKCFIFLFIAGLCFNWQVFAQVSSLNVNFDDGQASFVPINSDAGQPSYSLSVTSGILNIVTTKRVNDWSFLGMFSQNVNFSALPTVQFRVKASADVTFIVRVKTKVLSDPLADMVTIEKSVQLTGGSDFTSYFFDLTEDIAAATGFNSQKIEEIHIDCSKGWESPYSGTVEVDYLQLGYAKPVDAKGTGFVEDFNAAGVPAGVVPNTKYTFSIINEALDVNVGRDSRWFGFDYELDGSYDISANPFINVNLKTDADMILQVFLIDANGNGFQTALVGDQYKYDELVANKNEYRSARIYKGSSFIPVTFDFTTAKATIVDLKKIAKIKFVSNGTALTFNGKYAIDEIRIGDMAVKSAYIGQVPERNYLKNSTGTKEVQIPEIRNASEISVSGASTLIADAAVTPVTYTTKTEDGKSIEYGYAKLTYTIVPDAEGTDTITITATGKSGFADNTMKFAIHVKNNNLPTIDPIADLVVQNDIPVEIKLTGITSGDSQANQALTLTAASDNATVVDVVNVEYSSPDHYGRLLFSTKSAGTAIITLSLKDSEDSITNTSFSVTSYQSLNKPPVIDPIAKLTVTESSGTQTIVLSGLGDGDNSNQGLTFTGVSSEPGIIPDPLISYSYYQGSDTLSLTFTPTGTLGLATITITMTDDGGNPDNDGDKTTQLMIPIEVIKFNPTGWEFDLSAPGAIDYFRPESPGVVFFIAIVDTLGEKALRVTMKDKWTYAGIWTDIPTELNLSSLPIVSYDILSIDQSTWHWNYFYDAGSVRNIQNSGEHQFEVPADVWTTLSFDYRQPGDMNDDAGNPIDASRINAVLINMHNSVPSWPFTNASGVFYLRNLKFGDKAIYSPEPLYTAINAVAEQSSYENSSSNTILLSGISNGNKGTSDITLTGTSTITKTADITSISVVNEDGTATLTYTSFTSGSSVFKVKVEAPGAEPKTISFKIVVLKNNPSEFAKLVIDKTQKYQTIRGFGTFQTDSRYAELYTNDLGASAVRLGIIGNEWEPLNDNDDPNVTNMEGFNYDAFDWNYLRDLKAKGVETFILTSWSPPAWMKRNLSLDHKEQAIEWEKTDNILEPYYYDEFAESMVALVKAMKQEAGIDILAIGLQNEPYFNEPYPSAILSGAQFVKLIKIVGDRLKAEGLNDVGFYMPEQVFGIGSGIYSCEGYLATLKTDALADEYCDYFAVHGYDATGITPGFPTYDRWANLAELAQEGNNPKETWMTETYIGYSNWASALDFAGAVHGSLWAGKISLWTNWSWDGTQITKNIPNSTYYTSKNYYKYIRPGAVMTDAKSDNPNLLVTAFENTDGKFAIVVINKGTTPVSARIYGDNLPEEYHIYRTTMSENCVDAGILNTSETTMIFPPSSVVTLVADNNIALTMAQVADTTVLFNSGETVLSIEGISDGAGSTNDLTLDFVNSNSGLFSNISVSAIDANGSASLNFTPATDQVGVAQVNLTLKNTEGTERHVVFYIFVIDPTNVKALSDVQYSIYPNPASEQLNVVVSPNQFTEFTITDITGRFVLRQVITSDHTSISVGDWNKGIYVIKMKGENNSKIGRFVIE